MFNLLRRFYSVTKALPISSVLKDNAIGEQIQIKGWVKSLRKMKGTAFIDVNDGSCAQNLQVVLPIRSLKDLSTGSSVVATGILNKTPRGQLELSTQSVEIRGNCDLSDSYPLAPKKTYSVEYLRQCLHFRLRDTKFTSLLRVRDAATSAVHKFFQDHSYVNIHTPILTSNDCEGAGEVFSVLPHDKTNYFDSNVFLTVSGQLHLEAAAHSLSKVYTFGPTFRAENSKSRLHLSEFYMIEAECAFMDNLEQLMALTEGLLRNVTKDVLEKRNDDVSKCKEEVDFLWLDKEFVVLTHTEAIAILKSHDCKVNYNLSLNKEHEKFLVKHCGNVPVFVINWPKDIKPFYAKQLDNSYVAALDLLVPNVGELVGGSLREDNYDVLTNRLPSTELNWYLDLRRFGSVPTGGFGLGFERYLQFLLGINNIKDVIPFPRWPHNCKL